MRYQKLLLLLENLCVNNMLDVGCGDGRLLKSVIVEGGIKIGIDISLNVLKIAKKAEHQSAIFIAGDAMHIPFKEQAFDVVVASGIVDYLDKTDVVRFFCELHKVIRNEGFLLVTVPKLKSPFFLLRTVLGNVIKEKYFHLPPVLTTFKEEEISEVLSKTGFRVEMKDEVLKTTWIFLCVRQE